MTVASILSLIDDEEFIDEEFIDEELTPEEHMEFKAICHLHIGLIRAQDLKITEGACDECKKSNHECICANNYSQYIDVDMTIDDETLMRLQSIFQPQHDFYEKFTILNLSLGRVRIANIIRRSYTYMALKQTICIWMAGYIKKILEEEPVVDHDLMIKLRISAIMERQRQKETLFLIRQIN